MKKYNFKVGQRWEMLSNSNSDTYWPMRIIAKVGYGNGKIYFIFMKIGGDHDRDVCSGDFIPFDEYGKCAEDYRDVYDDFYINKLMSPVIKKGPQLL